MKRPRRLLYGWLRNPGEWCLSRQPPDVPVAYKQFPSMEEAEQVATESRYHVIWCGAALTMWEDAERKRCAMKAIEV